MSIPEHVICCGMQFLSRPAEDHMQERIDALRKALSEIQAEGDMHAEQLRQLAAEALQEDCPYPEG